MEEFLFVYVKRGIESFFTSYPVLALSAILLFLGRNMLGNAFERFMVIILKFRGKRIAKISNITLHPFFTYMQRSIVLTIPNLHLESKKKKIIIQNILLPNFTIFSTEFLLFASSSLDLLTAPQFRSKLLEIYLKCQNDSILCTVTNLKELGLSSDIIHYILTSFSQNHKSTSLIIENSVKEVCTSEFYSTNFERFSAILDLLKVGFDRMIEDSLLASSTMNGKIDIIDF